MNGETIFKIINKKKKEGLLFKYDVDTFEDLVLYNKFLTLKVSNYHVQFDLPKNVTFLNEYEKKISLSAIDNNSTQIGENDVTYDFNLLGYRGDKTLDTIKNSIGVFGCSFTFGVGVDKDNIFSASLEKKLCEPVHNFGIPGGSIQKLTKSFSVINNFYKLKTAIFMIPSFYRYEYMYAFNQHIGQCDFIPSYEPYEKKLHIPFNSLYESFEDVTFFNELAKNINIIKLNAKLNGTNIIFATWCHKTYELNKKYDLMDMTNQIVFIETYEKTLGLTVNDFARDGMHPGNRTHQQTAEILYNHIINNKKLI